MKPAPFDYYRPTSLAEALEILRDLTHAGQSAKVLAGGQSLVPLLNMRLARPDAVVDLNSLEAELGRIEVDGSALMVGALVRHWQVETDARIAAAAPVLREAERYVGHPAIRSRGTVGGSLAHADPAAELPVVATLLQASVTLANAERVRTVPVHEFFVTYLTTKLEVDELLVQVTLPRIPPRTGQAIVEFSERHGDFALAMAAASATLEADGRMAALRLVLGGVAGIPEDLSPELLPLIGAEPGPDLGRHVVDAVMRTITPDGDLHGSSEYRRELAATMATRALDAALGRAQTGPKSA